MKIFHICSTLALLLLIACSNSGGDDSVRSSARQSLGNPQPTNVAPPINAPSATTPNTPEPAQNAAGIWHYTCGNGCEGGAGSAVACATCGATLVHNQIYHNTAAAPTQPAAGSPNPISTQTVAPPTANEPPQNAAGIWHYTCGNGCEGGAGSAVACATCGSTLVHNQAYHN